MSISHDSTLQKAMVETDIFISDYCETMEEAIANVNEKVDIRRTEFAKYSIAINPTECAVTWYTRPILNCEIEGSIRHVFEEILQRNTENYLADIYELDLAE